MTPEDWFKMPTIKEPYTDEWNRTMFVVGDDGDYRFGYYVCSDGVAKVLFKIRYTPVKRP